MICNDKAIETVSANFAKFSTQQRQTITVILSSVIDLYACTLVKPYAGIYGN